MVEKKGAGHRRLTQAEAAAAAEEARTTSSTQNSRSQPDRSNIARPVVKTAAGDLSEASLKIDGDPDDNLFRHLYLGEFDKIQIDRSSPDLSAAGNGYIEGFWASCKDALTPDRTEIMETLCRTYRVVSDGYGVERSRTCIDSYQHGTGVYADRALYNALSSNPLQTLSSSMRFSMDTLLNGGNIFENASSAVAKIAQTRLDAASLPAQNNCTGAALRRFQENLQRFALGQEGKRLNGTVQLGVAMLPPAAGEVYRDSNYTKLLDEMVEEQSKTWAMNRYISGSIRAAHVDKRDPAGRPGSVSSKYSYTGVSRQVEGIVTLVFVEGKPRCLYFSDQPTTCRTPAPRITAAYIAGHFR